MVCLSLTFAVLAAPAARADELPGPNQVRQPRPRPPTPTELTPVAPEPPSVKFDAPVKVDAPAKVEAPVKVEVPAKVDAPVKVDAPAKADAPAKVDAPVKFDPKKTEAGGTCRVDGSAGAWPLLALLGLGVRRRRR